MIFMRIVRAAPSLTSVGACFLLAALVGCGSANTKARVSGKVIYKDAPVTGGTIQLYPASGPSFSIYIKPDGTFEVEDAPAGDMKVAVETDSVPANPPTLAGSGGTGGNTNSPKKVPIPAKFNKPE